MMNKNNVKLDKKQEAESWKEVLFACTRKSITGKRINMIESVNILKKYFSGESPILNINSPLPGQNGWTALYMSAYFGCVDECKFLLKMGANPEMCIQKGNSLLHIAAGRNFASLCNTLLNNGFDVDRINLTGKTSLMSACQSGSIDSSRELIINNASIDLRDNDNKNCFDYASQFSKSSNDFTLETMLLDAALNHEVPKNQVKENYKAAIKF